MISKKLQEVIIKDLPEGFENMTVQEAIIFQEKQRRINHQKKMKEWREKNATERKNYRLEWLAKNPDYYKNYFKSERGKQVNRKAQKKYQQKKKQIDPTSQKF